MTARVFREAGACVRQNVCMNVNVPTRDSRHIKVLAQNLPCFGGVQLAVDIMLRSSLTCNGEAHPHAAEHDRAVLAVKYKFIKTTFIKKFFSSKSTFIKNHFHQKPLSSKTNFIKMPLSSKCHFHQTPLSSKTIFIKNQFHQKPISSKTNFIRTLPVRGTHHPSKNNIVHVGLKCRVARAHGSKALARWLSSPPVSESTLCVSLFHLWVPRTRVQQQPPQQRTHVVHRAHAIQTEDGESEKRDFTVDTHAE